MTLYKRVLGQSQHVISESIWFSQKTFNQLSHNTRTASEHILLDYKRTNYGKFSLKFRGAQI